MVDNSQNKKLNGLSLLSNVAVERVAQINNRLKEIYVKLREIQPHIPGAVTISLNQCGKGCSGCPHVQYHKWRSGSLKGDGSGDRHYNGKYLKRPLLAVKPYPGFELCYEEVKKLIDETQKITKEKSKILKALVSLKKTIGS